MRFPMDSQSDPLFFVTGFGPFGDHKHNPSWDVARAAGETLGTDPHLLPVTFEVAAQFTRAHLQAVSTTRLFFVHFGLAADRSAVCFERRARNRRSDDPSTDDTSSADPSRLRPLVTDGRDQYPCLVDVSTLTEKYNRRASDALPDGRISKDCGAYVCNALYYHSLRACVEARTDGSAADALFVHVPPLDDSEAARVGQLVADIVTDLASSD